LEIGRSIHLNISHIDFDHNNNTEDGNNKNKNMKVIRGLYVFADEF